VNIISSTAERQSAVEFAKAQAMRPEIVGKALQEIYKDPEVGEALFDILEVQAMLSGDGRVVLIPEGAASGMLPQLLAMGPGGRWRSRRCSPRTRRSGCARRSRRECATAAQAAGRVRGRRAGRL